MWVKLHDKFLEWEWHDKPEMVALWLHLLLFANWKDRRWHGIVVRRGQLVTSLNSLNEATGISLRSIRTCLERLKNTGEIEEKTTNKFRIITICDYDSYQDKGTFNDKQTTNKRHSTDIQSTTPTDSTEYTEGQIILSKDNISPVESVVDFFNKTMASAVIPKIRGSSGKRKTAIQARIREHGIDAVYEMITIASKSDFLNGKNNRNWVANFDWLFLPTNFQKVIEGNYNDRINTSNTNDGGRKQRAAGYAGIIARLAAEDDARAAEVRQPRAVP